MRDLIVSINNNLIKVSFVTDSVFHSTVKEVNKEIVLDSKIINNSGVAEVLNAIIAEAPTKYRKRLTLNFVVEPEDVFFCFVTLSKSVPDAETALREEIRQKISDKNLDNYYYSYVKIAPFVYQVVAITKQVLENYIELGTLTNTPVQSVLPWVSLLPKYVGTNNSAIFVCSSAKNPSVALSELGGIYFTGSYDDNKTPEELNGLVQELSIYKRAKPIDMVYTFNYPHFKDVDGLMIHNIELPSLGEADVKGFESNVLVNFMLNLSPDLLTGQTNLLNMLPNQQPEQTAKVGSNKLLVPLSAIALAAVIFGGVFLIGYMRNNKKNSNNISKPATVITEVSQSTQSAPTPMPTSTPEKNLDRKDLVVRIENGSGVTGIAAKTKDLLEKLGYKVLEIDTAEMTRESTLYKFKNAKIDYKDMVSKDLLSVFPNFVTEDGIKTDNTYDLLIIVGTSEKL